MDAAPSTIHPATIVGTGGSVVTTSRVVADPASEPIPYRAIPAVTSSPGRPVSTPEDCEAEREREPPEPAHRCHRNPVGDHGMGAQDFPRSAWNRSRRPLPPGVPSDPGHEYRRQQHRDGSAHMSGIAPCLVTTQAATGGPATMLIR
jgi:hypothetical protein